ncbi:neuroligin-3-like, partial [Chelonus insularis]|uniref:neuroligin-3-like n=1 Tax=Chelonus insularis TaxID=460826 RepID=UPI0015891972
NAEYTDIVETDKGKVRGNILQTIHLKHHYSAFKGIPYAEPPIGHGRRFRRPVPAKPWSKVLDTTKDPNACAQWDIGVNNHYYDYIGSEDCLYLNVYTPELNFTNPRPRAVMAYIHGGSFQFGSIDSSKFGPDFLIEKDVVVVLMNYRLGIFGFLAFAPAYFDANNGLRDQAEALRWIQRNIRKFGGDPDKVTLFGESAGAASVEYHKLSPQSKGLFRASIAMSGTALNRWAYYLPEAASYLAWNVVDSYFYYYFSQRHLYSRMVNAPTNDLLYLQMLGTVSDLNPTLFRPTSEDPSLVTDPFLTDHPLNLYRSGSFTRKHHMLGFMKNEGLLVAAPVSVVTDFVSRFIANSLARAVTGISFTKDIDLTQRFLVSHGGAPVYYYQNSFDYAQALHKVGAMRSMDGASHGDDVAHLFWVSDQQQPIDPDSDIGRHRQRVVTMWTNFAKYLKPIVDDKGNDTLNNIKWEESGPAGGYLDIDKNPVFHAESRPTSEHTNVVETDKGQVRGKILQTLHLKHHYSAFKGIPYAEPPIGHGRRFRRPVPAKPWNDVLNAFNDPNKCAQWTMTLTNYYHGSEDCLYLNVFTPELNFTNPRPRAVMAYIHGGAFEFGSSDSSELGPDFLIEKDVVVVTMNYRLGVFGFLTLRSQIIDANNGLRDQVEALRWIQRNIRKFGGDPDKVTIFGESAGSASVEYHKLSPQSKDLFRASIAMSGSALNEWAFSSIEESYRMGRNFVNSLFNYWNNEEELYKRLVDVSTEFLLDMHWFFCLWYDPIPFRPTIEDSSLIIDPFLSNHPMELYRTQQFSMKPHMLGAMAEEGISFVAPVSIITDILGNSFTKLLSAAVTGVAFLRDIDLTQRFLSSFSDAPVYYYINSFDYDQALHKVGAMRSQSGAGHGDDIAHVFWVSDKHQPIDPNSDIGKQRQKIVTMWTNFAKYLKPIPDDKDDPILGDAKWEKSTSDGGYLDINSDLIYRANDRPVTEFIEQLEYDRVRLQGY